MRLVSYQVPSGTTNTIGLCVNNVIVGLNALDEFCQQHEVTTTVKADPFPTDMIALLESKEKFWGRLEGLWRWLDTHQGDAALVASCPWAHAMDDVTLLPPVLQPLKVIALAFNYPSHATEARIHLSTDPLLFHKTASSLVGHGQPIRLPRFSKEIDYEGELAFIIGKTARHVSEADAYQYVAGYCCGIDVVARDVEARSTWTNGAMIETFCPLGPYLVTVDEIPEPNALTLRSSLNGQIMQHANTSQMRFSVAQILAYISLLITLEPGDVILTGTPAGVGGFRDPPVFVKPQDQITVDITGLGRLSNPVISDEAAACP